MRGILVTNAFLKNDKFAEHYIWLEEAAGRQGMSLSLLENTNLLSVIGGGSALPYDGLPEELAKLAEENDFVIYWDKDISQGKLLEACCDRQGVRIFNRIDAIAACDDKMETYYRIWRWNMQCEKQQKIPLLPTVMAPMTYANVGYTQTAFVDRVIEKLGLPMVVKECFGSFGMQVYLAEDRERVMDLTEQLSGRPFLYQSFLKSSSGRDVRLEVVGDEVVAAMYRYSETGDFRANITNGGSMKPYVPSERERNLAVRAARALGLDFGGVDLLFSGESGEADILCEVNSNAHFKNIYTCTGVNAADRILQYIKKKVSGGSEWKEASR